MSEFHPQSLSVALGLYVLRGSRHEARSAGGITHFLEHLVFKGTKKRSALDIVRSLEVLGGELNAYTTREYTVYHALCLKEHWREALDVITDLVQGMALSENDFQLERSVVLQEINMIDEDLEDHISDYFFENWLPENSLGTPILGKEESVGSLRRSDLREYYKTEYTSDRIIVSAAGNIQHDELKNFAEKCLRNKTPYQGRAREKSGSRWYATPKPRVFRSTEEKKSEQLHLYMGLPVNSYSDKLRYEAYVINALLGGGMTSRIFQSVREKKGLVYSIYSNLNTFSDLGCLNIYAGSEAKNMPEVVQTISQQVRKLRKNGLRRSELERFKTQVTGSLLLSSEDIENRLSYMTTNEMIFQDYRDIYRMKADIEKISMDSIHEFVDRYINIDKMAAVVMGEDAHRLQTRIENL